MAEELSLEARVVDIRRYRDRRSGRPQPLGKVSGQPQLLEVAQHQVHARYGGDGLRVNLGVAAGHRDDAGRVQTLGEPYLVSAGSVALGRDGARVYHAHGGGGVPSHEAVPLDEERLLHLRRLALVELAADSAERDSLGRCWMDVGERHFRRGIASVSFVLATRVRSHQRTAGC